MIPLKVETLSSGGCVERLQDEIQRAIANICDPNTPAKKPRKIKLEITIKPNEQRNMAEVMVKTSSTLCPPEPLETSICAYFCKGWDADHVRGCKIEHDAAKAYGLEIIYEK